MESNEEQQISPANADPRIRRALAQIARGVLTEAMLSQMVTDEQILAASNSDVLAGTQLDQPGVPGVYTIWAVSDQIDSTITIRMGGRTIVSEGAITQRSGVVILESDDPFFQMVSAGLGRPVIIITEVTAMSCRVRTRFIPARAS